MKNINRLILRYVCEIFVVVLFVAVSIPIWEKFDKSNIANIASSYHTMDYLYLDIDKYISNESFEDVVAVVNDTNTARNYKLILKVSKEKNNNVKININNEVKNLKDLSYDEDKLYFYYNISESNLVANRNEYKISFIDSNISYEDVQYEIIENHDI